MENSTPPKKTDVLVIDDKEYGNKFDKYMVQYNEVREKSIAWV